MSEYVLPLVCVVLALQAGAIALGGLIYRRVLGHLRAAAEQQRETWALLHVIKEYAASARTHHQDARAAADAIVPAVEQVPERTADLVVGRIHKDDPGHKAPAPTAG